MKLTKHQIEVLRALNAGSMITVNVQNMPSMNGEPLHPQTRYFLTDNRLVTRLDKERAIGVKGNGLVISSKGREILAAIE